MRLRKTSCLGKHKHKSRGAAEAHVRSRERRGLPGGKAYACVFCRQWHVVSHPAEEKSHAAS